MTVFAAVLVAALILSNYLWIRALLAEREAAFRREQNLLNRIQQPDRIQPVADMPMPPDEELRTKPVDEYDLVGTVQSTDPDG